MEFSEELQTRVRGGTHAYSSWRGKAEADPNILGEYLMAWDKVTIERCLGSRQSFRMLLPGGFP